MAEELDIVWGHKHFDRLRGIIEREGIKDELIKKLAHIIFLTFDEHANIRFDRYKELDSDTLEELYVLFPVVLGDAVWERFLASIDVDIAKGDHHDAGS